MLGIILGLVFGAVFFTYKPLFRVLKVSKFKIENIKLELAKEETKKEFNDFAGKQADLISKLLLKLIAFLGSVFAKKQNKQEKNAAQQSSLDSSKQNSSDSNNTQESSQNNARK